MRPTQKNVHSYMYQVIEVKFSTYFPCYRHEAVTILSYTIETVSIFLAHMSQPRSKKCNTELGETRADTICILNAWNFNIPKSTQQLAMRNTWNYFFAERTHKIIFDLSPLMCQDKANTDDRMYIHWKWKRRCMFQFMSGLFLIKNV